MSAGMGLVAARPMATKRAGRSVTLVSSLVAGGVLPARESLPIRESLPVAQILTFHLVHRLNPFRRPSETAIAESLTVNSIVNSLVIKQAVPKSSDTATGIPGRHRLSAVTLTATTTSNTRTSNIIITESATSTAGNMTTPSLPPATDSVANKLLPPKRRRQIEIWLDEAIHFEAQQKCASDKRHGHVSDLKSSSLAQHLNQTLSPSEPTKCAVCSRYFKGDESPRAASSASEKPLDPQANQNNSKSLFRSLKSVMAAFRPKNSKDGYDPALATKMFLISSADNDCASTTSSSNARLGSSDNNDGGKQILDEKLARLKRAQKLLAKS